MAANPINKYYKNYTVKENDPYGFGRFAKGSIQRGQQLSAADTDITTRKAVDVSTVNDTFKLRTNTPGQSIQILKKGLDVYKQNNRNLRRNIDRTKSINTSNDQTVPTILRTASSITGNSKNSALPNVFANRIKTNTNRAVDAYRNTAFSNKINSGPLSKGSGLFTGSAGKPLSGGLLSAAKIAAPGNRNSGNTLMKQGITQYKSFDSNKKIKNNELIEDTEFFIESGVKNLKERETL